MSDVLEIRPGGGHFDENADGTPKAKGVGGRREVRWPTETQRETWIRRRSPITARLLFFMNLHRVFQVQYEFAGSTAISDARRAAGASTVRWVNNR